MVKLLLYPSIFKPLLLNKKKFLDSDPVVTPMDRYWKEWIFDIFSATQNNEKFFKLFVLKLISNLMLDIFRLIQPISHKRGTNESF